MLDFLIRTEIFTHMKDQNLKQQAYDYLKTKILDCDIKPGEYINEKKVLESAAISRTPFREAVIMLQGEHLVEVRPRYGTFASKLTKSDVVEVFSMRKMLEPVVVYTYLNKIDISILLANDRELYKLSQNSEKVHASEICKIDMAFHSFFIESSGNERLKRLFTPIFQDAYRISMFNNWYTKSSGNTWKETYEHHHKILDAILKEDQQEIIQTYNIHLNYYLGSALQTIGQYEKEHLND